MGGRLRYKEPWADRAKEFSYRLADGAATGKSANLEFAAAVATFGMVLAKSAHLGEASLSLAIELAEPLSAKDECRTEFVALVRKARAILQARDVTAAK